LDKVNTETKAKRQRSVIAAT